MKYITEVEELSKSIKLFEGKKVLGSDIETTGFCPFEDKLRLLQLSDGDNTLVIDVFKVGREAVAHYTRPILEDESVVKIFHNGKFDAKFIKQQLEIDVSKMFDSYIASLLIEGGVSKEKGYHGLGQVLPRYTGIEINKDEQLSDWSVNELSEEQLRYSALDAENLLPLREAQIETLTKLGLKRCAKLEFEAILPIAFIELCGFYLDFDEWMAVANSQLTKAQQHSDKIFAALKPVIPQGSLFGEVNVNLDSHVQIQKYFRLLGIDMPESTKEYLLTPLAKKHEIVADLLEYRGFTKSYTSFGDEFKEFINPVTGRIHAQFMQIGASTGRLAVSKPNTNQIPSDVEHRSCFKAQNPENTLISNDFSQEELRILADFSGDKKFKAAFKAGDDFHTATAALVFNIPLEKVDPQARYLAKRLNFGLTYGVGIAKFALMAGISEAEAQIIRNNYFDTFKGVRRWINYQKQLVTRTKSARTASGRIALYEYDEDDNQARARAQRNAVNTPIQGTGADILKRALKLFYDKACKNQNKIKIVNVVHDQIDLEVPKSQADEIKETLRDCMIQAGSEFVKTVDIKVDSKVNDRWIKD